jgi:NAD(P)-dependent dehydrogenase (short-subunit alcohol dehydrogenase family)
MPELAGRVALITGAASGIGLAAAEAIAREGADVALLSRPSDDLDAAAQRAAAHGGKVMTIGVDVADSAGVRDAIERVEAELGPLDAVHNNAGISMAIPLTDTTDDAFRRLVDTNLAGSFFVLREAVRVMKSRRKGAIVNTGSELALIGQAGYVAYTATKGAILAMTRSAAAELASWGIRVNAVCPGTTRTPMFLAEFDDVADPEAELADNAASVAMGRIAEPSEIAEAVVFLLSNRAGYVTGTQLVADGGRTTCVAAGSIGVASSHPTTHGEPT